MSRIILAHGLGGRSDLPVPLWLALYGAAAAVVVSFFALGAFWRDPRFRCGAAGKPLDRLNALADAAVTRRLLRALGLGLFLITLIVLAAGPDTSATNPGPTWFYVWFWVGLLPASIAFGPIWKRLNPLRSIVRTLNRLVGDEDETAIRAYPERLGYWPAVASIAAFVWLELVYDRPDDPAIVLLFVLLYAGVHVTAAIRYGESWFERGDGFEVYSSLLARLSPFGRRADGRLVVRNPFDGLCSLEPRPGLVALVSVVLGSTAFDGLTRTQLWQDLSGGTSGIAYLALGSGGLALATAFVWLTFTAATTASQGLAREAPRNGTGGDAAAFVHSLIPIAAGYTIAHYFSLLVFQGQVGYILASDPLARGWDLFGTTGWTVNFVAVSTATIAWVQVAAIVVGHVMGVVAAHDRAVGTFTRSDQVRAQYPLLAIMVVYTLGGIFLLVGT